MFRSVSYSELALWPVLSLEDGPLFIKASKTYRDSMVSSGLHFLLKIFKYYIIKKSLCLFSINLFQCLLAKKHTFYHFYIAAKLLWLVRHSTHRPCCPHTSGPPVPAWRHLADYTLVAPWAAMVVEAFPASQKVTSPNLLIKTHSYKNPSFPEQLGCSQLWPPARYTIFSLPWPFHKPSLISHQTLVSTRSG